jgi:hypothetical protein
MPLYALHILLAIASLSIHGIRRKLEPPLNLTLQLQLRIPAD